MSAARMKKIIANALKVETDISGARLQRESRELRRLETLIDTVFALAIIMIVWDEPSPTQAASVDLLGFIKERAQHMLMAFIGIVVVLVYWFQSNLLLGNLSRTDPKHAILSVLQIFMVLVYLLTVSYGIDIGNEPLILAMQSIAAALIGFTAAGAWWYASYRRRLLTDEADDSDVSALRLRVLAEPLTAILTIGLAFVDPMLWELGWLTFPLFVFILQRVGVRH
jgi:uncharacterized membrane protein